MLWLRALNFSASAPANTPVLTKAPVPAKAPTSDMGSKVFAQEI